MWEWYWSLSGFMWFFVTLLMGGAGIGTLGLIVILSARSIANSFDHDPQKCGCPTCEGKRARYLNRQAQNSERLKRRIPEITPGAFISTAELRRGMLVTSEKGELYEFQGMRQRSYGYTVIFRNLKNDAAVWIMVSLPKMHTRMWRVANNNNIRRLYGL